MGERIAVVGTGETPHTLRRPDVNQAELANEAVRAALEDAQLTLKDIDIVISSNIELLDGCYNSDMWLAECNGAYLKPGFKVQSGGTTGSTVSEQAFNLAATGLFNTVLAVTFQRGDEGSTAAGFRRIVEDAFMNTGPGSAGAPVGVYFHASWGYDLLSRGACTEEHAAALRVKESICASKNPNAHLRKVFTKEDVMNSRMLVTPVRLYHMCPNSTGACAIIVAPEKKAKKITNRPAWIKDSVTVHGGRRVTGAKGRPWSWGIEQAAIKLYKSCGITNPRQEIDVIEIYDASTWQEIGEYEDLHICEYGEPWKLIEEGATALDGDIPVNPSGGVIATNATGDSAMLRIAEAAMQIRGTAGEHQVPDVRQALASTMGGWDYSTAVLFTKNL